MEIGEVSELILAVHKAILAELFHVRVKHVIGLRISHRHEALRVAEHVTVLRTFHDRVHT